MRRLPPISTLNDTLFPSTTLFRSRQARRRAEREFNLSFADALRDDNKVVDGKFWGKTVPAQPELSIEEDFAQSLGWELGDDITFDIAGQRFEGRITSLRSIDWESFRPNFFVLASPGALDGYPASYITAVSVPESQRSEEHTSELQSLMRNS